MTENRYFLSMAITDDEIAQVRAATDLVPSLANRGSQAHGPTLGGVVPFHGEKTPSFSVNAELGRYYCFGCRASGDQITWVREFQHMDFIDAVATLGRPCGH